MQKLEFNGKLSFYHLSDKLAMNYWLMKSEPDVFGIHDLYQRPNQTEPWDGVQAWGSSLVVKHSAPRGTGFVTYTHQAKSSPDHFFSAT